jgi:hypothetical protein
MTKEKANGILGNSEKEEPDSANIEGVNSDITKFKRGSLTSQVTNATTPCVKK